MTSGTAINEAPWDRAEFERQLRAKGAGYHITTASTCA